MANANNTNSRSFFQLFDLLRTLNARLMQQQRRNRVDRALDWLEATYPGLTIEQKQYWVRKLEQKWGRERLAALDEAKQRIGREQLTTEERNAVLAESWARVDADIERGDLPSPVRSASHCQ
jgi:hypothetical protein